MPENVHIERWDVENSRSLSAMDVATLEFENFLKKGLVIG